MSKIKFFTAVVLCVCLSLSALCIYAQEPDISPYNIAIISTDLSFSINSTGVASCYGSVSVRAGYTVRLVMQLQQKGSMWKTVQSWNGTDSAVVAFDETYQVEKGYEYRLMNVYIAYDADGNQVEAFYDTSNIVEYK
ncbi:MAG: hypothetical protein IJ435_07575 [Clostridia bacterium]|nr:hypothetical protein [Clostridia bacterium]